MTYNVDKRGYYGEFGGAYIPEMLYPNIENLLPKSLKIISYGTERLDQPTLNFLCKKFPSIDFRQTYGMSELGILRVKSESRQSLYMKIGGEGVQWKVINKILYIKAENKEIKYIGRKPAASPASGYLKKHLAEQNEILEKVLGKFN